MWVQPQSPSGFQPPAQSAIRQDDVVSAACSAHRNIVEQIGDRPEGFNQEHPQSLRHPGSHRALLFGDRWARGLQRQDVGWFPLSVTSPVEVSSLVSGAPQAAPGPSGLKFLSLRHIAPRVWTFSEVTSGHLGHKPWCHTHTMGGLTSALAKTPQGTPRGCFNGAVRPCPPACQALLCFGSQDPQG